MRRWTQSQRLLLSALLIAGTVSCLADGGEDRRPDLEQLRTFLEIDQSYSPEARKQADRRIDELLDGGRSLSDASFFLAVAEVVAMADNGHSNLSMRSVGRQFGLVPIRTFWFADGLFVVRAIERHAGLLGGRVLSIAGRPIDEVENSMKIYHGGTREHFRAYFARDLFFSPALLHAAGVSKDPGRVEIAVEFADGEVRREVLETDPKSHQPAATQPWHVLLPTALPGEDARWRSVSADSAEDMPLYLRDSQVDFRISMISSEVGYLQLKNNFADRRESLRDYLARLRSELEAAAPEHLVLDLRLNSGGDLTRSAQFMLDLPTLIPGEIFVLTGNATFSAGIYSAFFPKSAAPGRVTVVGERVGDRTRFWAETGREPFVLADSGLFISHSLQLHDIGAGCHDPDRCHMMRHDRSWNLAVGTLEPDRVVSLTFADFVARRDPQLEAALELIAASLQFQRAGSR